MQFLLSDFLWYWMITFSERDLCLTAWMDHSNCVQKKLWTFDWGDGFTVMIVWMLMFSTLIFISQISRTDSLGREAFAHYPPPLEPPPALAYIVPFQFPSCNHGIHPQQLKRVTSRMHQLLPSLLPTKCSQNTVIIELKKQDIPTFTNFPGPPRPIYTGSKATRPTQKRRKVAVLFMARHESSLNYKYNYN